jgi:SAM-dependent methyltransferase
MVSNSLAADYWQNRYNQGTTGWDRGEPSPGLKWFQQQVSSADCPRVLVPGCGRGHEVSALAAAGYAVTAIDFAPAAVNQVQATLAARQLNAEILQADLLEYSPSAPFDAVYEQTCLCAMHPDQWSQYVQKLTQWLRPGGKLFAVFMQTTSSEGPPFACRLPQMRQLFGSEVWEWHPVLGRIDHPLGLHEWACLLQRRL